MPRYKTGEGPVERERSRGRQLRISFEEGISLAKVMETMKLLAAMPKIHDEYIFFVHPEMKKDLEEYLDKEDGFDIMKTGGAHEDTAKAVSNQGSFSTGYLTDDGTWKPFTGKDIPY